MTPEGLVAMINAGVLAIAYFGVYPRLQPLTLGRILRLDLVFSLAALVCAGVWFQGSGYRFNMILFETNWFWFSLLSLMIIETPLFLWFIKRHGLSMDDLDE